MIQLPRHTVFCFLIPYLWYSQQLLLTCNALSGESPKPCWSKTDMKVRSKHMNGCSVLGVSHAAEWKLAIYNLKWIFTNYINLQVSALPLNYHLILYLIFFFVSLQNCHNVALFSCLLGDALSRTWVMYNRLKMVSVWGWFDELF